MRRRWFAVALTVSFLAALALHSQQPRRPTSPPKPKAEKVVVYKKERELHLLREGKAFRTYRIALGRNPVGPKRQQGDSKTPEGNYVIDYRNRHSQFHRSLHISYPNAEDKRQARARGVSPGGLIMIHGLPNGMGYIGAAHRLRDWTDGCIAVTSEEIEEIWDLVPDGTPIEILAEAPKATVPPTPRRS